MNETVVLGAGLAGLSTAYHLRSGYRLFEAASLPGGVAGSFSLNGFTFDHAIHILYTKDPYASSLIRSLLAGNYSEQERSSWVYSHNTYTAYPYQGNLRGLPPKVIFENLTGLLKTKYRPAANAPENFEDWIIRSFGAGIAKNFMLPFNKKVWAADPASMSSEWVESRIPRPRLRDVVKGIVRKHDDARYGTNVKFWYPRMGGTAALANGFLPFIQNLHLGARCSRIDTRNREVYFSNGQKLSYRNMVSTLPLPKVVSLLENVPGEVHEATMRLRANRVYTVNIGIDREGISDKHWVYFPEADFPFQRISFPANFSSSLVPQGTSSVMAEISCSADRPIVENDLVAETMKKLIDIGILRTTDRILAIKLVCIDPAYIIYDSYHRSAVDTICSYLRNVSIVPCGRFGEWEYLNMDETILSGKRAAEEILRS
jgi:UDP-galactopyranose mutase